MFKIVGAFFIFVGITILTSGFTRGKNAVGAVIRNFLCLSCAFLFYWFIGFGFSFSKGNALIGYFDFFSQGTYASISDLLVSGILCGCICAIYESSMHERCKIAPLVIVSCFVGSLVYPIALHWTLHGFLSALGCISNQLCVFALLSGMIALSGTYVISYRKDKYTDDGDVRAIVGENPVFGSIGGCLIILGVFCLIEDTNIFVSVLLSSLSAVLVCTFLCVMRYHSVDLSLMINSAIAGSIASSGVTTSYIGLMSGCIAGAVMIPLVEFLERKKKIDDATGMISTMLIAGCIGILFSSRSIFAQCAGMISIVVFSGAVSLFMWKEVKHFVGLRVSEREENEGVDTYARGITHAYLKYMPNVKENGIGNPEYTRLPDVLPDENVTIRPSSATASHITKVEIITRRSAFEKLKKALDAIGVSGMTVSEVMGCGMQKGAAEYYRGVPMESFLLEKIRIEIVISKVPVDLVVNTARRALYTGHIGDGKIFVYDVRDALKVRTGETGVAALQAVDDIEDVG